MTAIETIRKFLNENPTQAYCDDCLSALLKIKPRQTVQQKTSALAKIYPFHRFSGRCARCKAIKFIVGLRSADSAGQSKQLFAAKSTTVENSAPTAADLSIFSEDEVKEVLKRWLSATGWSVEIAWAKSRGIDIHARRNNERWVIEVKGGGSLNAMRVNYFLGILGETLQRMDDANAMYSIALPDLKQFRNLWSRLPTLAKERTQISALFVTRDGLVDKVTR